jgi:hypothetical protein
MSSFLYIIDTTFNTNLLKLLLSVIVNIDSCGKIFPVAYYYITSESAASFKFVAAQLSDLTFYNCPGNAVIVGDFSKGLGAAYMAKAALDLGLTDIADEPLVYPPERDLEIPEDAKVIISENNRRTQHVTL